MINEGAIAALREDLSLCLPGLLRDALNQYREFAGSVPPDDAKGFAAHQAACKSALGHIEALLKLNQGLSTPKVSPDSATAEGDDCAALIQEAEAYLDAFVGGKIGDGDD